LGPANRHTSIEEIRRWFKALVPTHPAHQERVLLNHPWSTVFGWYSALTPDNAGNFKAQFCYTAPPMCVGGALSSPTYLDFSDPRPIKILILAGKPQTGINH